MTGGLDTGTTAKKFFPKWAKAVAEGKTPPAGGAGGAIGGPALIPLTAGFTGGGTAQVTCDVSGGPSSNSATVEISALSVGGQAFSPLIFMVPVATSAAEAAQEIAVQIDGQTSGGLTLHASVANTDDVVVTEDAGGVFDNDPTISIVEN